MNWPFISNVETCRHLHRYSKVPFNACKPADCLFSATAGCCRQRSSRSARLRAANAIRDNDPSQSANQLDDETGVPHSGNLSHQAACLRTCCDVVGMTSVQSPCEQLKKPVAAATAQHDAREPASSAGLALPLHLHATAEAVDARLYELTCTSHASRCATTPVPRRCRPPPARSADSESGASRYPVASYTSSRYSCSSCTESTQRERCSVWQHRLRMRCQYK